MGKVLLVEDEPDVARLIASALHHREHEVVCAQNDQDAYERLEAEGGRFDLLIADINLGEGTTGFDVARRARLLNPAVRVVYIAGDVSHVERFGVDAALFVAKPFYPEDLADQVDRLFPS